MNRDLQMAMFSVLAENYADLHARISFLERRLLSQEDREELEVELTEYLESDKHQLDVEEIQEMLLNEVYDLLDDDDLDDNF